MPKKTGPQQLLRHRINGRILIATPQLLRHPDMIPVDLEDEVIEVEIPKKAEEPAVFDPETILANGEAVRIAEASKDVMADYAERHFGQKMDKRKGQDAMATELRDLIAENGHPDAD